jgi:hypothetical protein
MNRGLSHHHVYNYCKVVINVSKNINTLFACCVQCIPFMIIFSCLTNWWLHIQNWHLVYVSYHFSIITIFYLSCVFLIHLGFVDTLKKLNYKLLCMSKHNKYIYIFQNTWTRGCHAYMSMVVVR